MPRANTPAPDAAPVQPDGSLCRGCALYRDGQCEHLQSHLQSAPTAVIAGCTEYTPIPPTGEQEQ